VLSVNIKKTSITHQLSIYQQKNKIKTNKSKEKEKEKFTGLS
jgi:hypothetical protein